MYKNLSKPRFILILCVAIFLLVILFSQFIVLSVLRTKNQNVNSELETKEKELALNEQKINSQNSTKDALRQEGYIYEGEEITAEE